MFLNKAVIFTVALVVVVCATQSVFAADDMTKKDACYKGIEVYITGQFEKARDIFNNVAKKKDACSQFQIGMMYFYGHGVKKSRKDAEIWLKKSSSNGFKKAATLLDLIKNNNKNKNSEYWESVPL